MTDTSKPLSPEQIAEWKRLADAATKGSLMGLAITALIAEVERLTAELSEDKALMLETANETERVLAQLRAREVRKALGGKQMNEIPQWALMAANAAIGSRPDAIPPRYWLDVRDAFALALADERERCAKIAQEFCEPSVGTVFWPSRIAAAIRKGDA